MSPEQESSQETRDVWNLFSKFTNEELDFLLESAGVKPTKDRGLKLHQVLIVWFHGFIPNLTEVTKLAQEK